MDSAPPFALSASEEIEQPVQESAPTARRLSTWGRLGAKVSVNGVVILGVDVVTKCRPALTGCDRERGASLNLFQPLLESVQRDLRLGLVIGS